MPETFHSEMVKMASMAVDNAKRNWSIDLDFSINSIDSVESILGRIATEIKTKRSTPQSIQPVALMWGAYIGEIIRRERPCRWEPDSKALGKGKFPLVFDGRNEIYPVIWAFRRLTEGPEENVAEKVRVLKGQDFWRQF